jgi:hypothetical protein
MTPRCYTGGLPRDVRSSPAMSPSPLLTAVIFVVVVVAAWFSPRPYRPWYRAAILFGTTYIAPRSSLFVYLVTTSFFAVAGVFVLTVREPSSFRTVPRDGLATGRASALVKTRIAVPFLRIALATFIVGSWAYYATWKFYVWYFGGVGVVLATLPIVPNGYRHRFALAVYCLAASFVVVLKVVLPSLASR